MDYCCAELQLLMTGGEKRGGRGGDDSGGKQVPGTRGTREQDEDVSKSWLEVGGVKSNSVLDNLSRLYKKSKH